MCILEGFKTFFLMKSRNIRCLTSSSAHNSLLQGMTDAEVDFPFRVSPEEQRIIELGPSASRPPQSIILLGRSGTGKTTCAVFRMFGVWLASRHDTRVHNMVRAPQLRHPFHCVTLPRLAT